MPGIEQFKEPTSVDYLFIDSMNRVHLLVPLIGGETIALDNTCKTGFELERFLHGVVDGKKTSASAVEILKEYNVALQHDIDILKTMNKPSILRKKLERQRQINCYINMLKQCRSNPNGYSNARNAIYRGMHEILTSKNNCLGMRLSPEREDRYLQVLNPVFTLLRKPNIGLGSCLRDSFNSKLIIQSPLNKENIINQAIAHFADQVPFDFQKLQQFLQNEIQSQFSETVDLTTAENSGYACFLMSAPPGKIDLTPLSTDTPVHIMHVSLLPQA
jgi:hypothetical protein